MFLTDLAQACRKSGLPVQEQSGWQNRGHGQMSGVRSIICHHTAGPATGEAPSLGVVTNGRPGLAGPLSHLVLGRSGTVYVVAAGLCSHTGNTFEVQQGNAWAIGIEAEATGVSAWPPVQYDAYTKLCRALIDHYGLPVGRVFGHKEIASPLGRKIDPNFPMDVFRAIVATVELGEEMTPEERNWLNNLYLAMFAGGASTPENKSLLGLVDEVRRQEVVPLDYTVHHGNVLDNQYGQVLSIRKELGEARARLEDLASEGIVIDYDLLASKVADMLAARLKD